MSAMATIPTSPHPDRACDQTCDVTDEAHGYGGVFLAPTDVPARASFATLLAAYRAEQNGSVEALTYAQHIVERLIADDHFGQLAALRRRLDSFWQLVPTDMWSAVDEAVKMLDAIVGEA